MKNQKGVSLITLVITIIVVIILAAIALGGGAGDIPGQAQISGFGKDISTVEESVQVAAKKDRADEAITGYNRTDAELYNYIARGGKETIEPTPSGDEKWLTAADADAVPCTLIDKAYAEKILGAALPTRKVETYYGNTQEVSYYVTPKGQVFCWPPYSYDEKSYVTENVTVKTKDGDELPGTDATNPAKIGDAAIITFPDTNETVAVVVSASTVTPTVATKNFVATMANGEKVGVWYSELDANGSDTHRGVAKGIDYSTYNNTIKVTP